MQALVLTLNSAEQHEHVISVIQSALINGQAQPWMYEVLALSMELTGRPRDDIERVVLSLSDFGAADFGSMMMSAAYLTQFGRREASLRLYRQASALVPERAEPYILGLKHARHVKSAEDVEWAACGILRHAWTRDFAELHREAENAALEAEQRLQTGGDAAGADRLKAAVAEARTRDLIVRLHWSGGGDLDLIVEEPSGAACSFQNRETPGGGVLTHDGYGPDAKNCFEEYVCAQGVRGEYRLRVRHAWGQIVGGRATLTVVRHAGSPDETVESHPIVLGAEETVVRVDLPDGRRTQLRTAATFDVRGIVPPERPRQRAGDPAAGDAALAEFEDSRRRTDRLAGAVGFQPIIQIIPDGAQLSALAVVSADRRYVRISTLPLFTNITDVATFSFISGAGGTVGGGAGAGGGIGTGGGAP